MESNQSVNTLYSPSFTTEWETFQLYGIANWLNGMAFRDFEFSCSGLPVIKIAEIKNGVSGQTRYTTRSYDEKYLIKNGDMLFAWSGQPETSIDVYYWRDKSGWLNQHIFKIATTDICNKNYFYYLLKYLKPNFIAIAHNKQTTGLGHVTIKDLQKITVSLPPLPEQRAIADVLSALDDKIDLNRRMNTTLESLAQAIFKHMFLDNPEREGWVEKRLDCVCSFEYGKALKESSRELGIIPVYGSNGLIGFHNESLVRGPGIVVGRKGNPGIVTFVQTDFFPIDTTFYVVVKDDLSLYWLFFVLSDLNLPNLGSDSAVPGLNRNIAYMSIVVVPPKTFSNEFAQMVKPLFDKIYVNIEESKKLAKLRDTLLPKLMSGRLKVNNLG